MSEVSTNQAAGVSPIASEDIGSDCEKQAQLPPDQSASPVDVGRAARQGGVWAALSYGLSKILGLSSSIVLARLLLPEHFGLIAMVNTVLGLVQMLGNFGIASALMHQRDDVDEHANTTWWASMAAGVLLFGIVNAAAPSAARYYHQPQLPLLVLVAGLNFLVNPIGGTHGTLLLRSLRFRDNTRIGMVGAMLTSLFTIVFAAAGAGVWSFVFPTIISNVVTSVMTWRAYRFSPSWPVNWSLLGHMLKFGANVFGARLLDYINQNVDYILVGALLGGTRLGFYFFAYSQGTWVVQNIGSIIANLTFPTFASLQADPDRARAMFLKLIRVISLLGFPIIGMQWALTPLYIGAIYGEKWLPCVVAFRFIALYGIGRTVCAPGGSLMSALGRPDVNLKLSAAMCPVLVTSIFVGSHYGINGVAAATAIGHGLFVWLYLFVPFRILKWRFRDVLATLAPAFISTVIASAAAGLSYTHLAGGVRSIPVLIMCLSIGVVTYVTALHVLFRGVAEESRSLFVTTVMDALGRRLAKRPATTCSSGLKTLNDDIEALGSLSAFDRYSVSLGAERDCVFDRAVNPFLQPWIALIPVGPRDRVLDLGVGWGHSSVELARRGCAVTSADTDHERLRFIRLRFEEEGLAGEVVRIDEPLVLPFDDGCFDAVVARDLFDETTSAVCGSSDRVRQALLSEIRRVLKPGGLAVIGAANRWSCYGLLRSLSRSGCGLRGYRSVLRRSGFGSTSVLCPLPGREQCQHLFDIGDRAACLYAAKNLMTGRRRGRALLQLAGRMGILPYLAPGYLMFTHADASGISS